MEEEVDKAFSVVSDVKRQFEGKDKFELPGIQPKSQQKAAEEILSTKSTALGPINLTDYFDMASGCTLLENGKTKASTKKLVHTFKGTNVEKMNKTDYSNKYS